MVCSFMHFKLGILFFRLKTRSFEPTCPLQAPGNLGKRAGLLDL